MPYPYRTPRLAQTASAGELATRRRLVIVAAALVLAATGGVIGALVAPSGPSGPAAATGPFSYFPS